MLLALALMAAGYDDPSRGLRLEHPSTWRVYPQALTQAISARDQITLGTFPLVQSSPDPNCTPSTALECFGPSFRVDFRTGGRAFTAHVYGPPARRRQALAILDSLRVRPAPFDTRLHAAHFPSAPGWRTRISGPSDENPSCVRQRVSWASTVPFRDGPMQLPPDRMIQSLPPDGIIIAATQYVDRCRRLRGLPALRPPLSLDRAKRSGFPGPRGDELPLYTILGRFAGRYDFDVWVFYGRPTPTHAQRAAAQRELRGVRWSAWL
jgi:hypothetical protein